MVGKREPSFLKQTAESCLLRLRALKPLADSTLSSARKRKLHNDVVQKVNDCSRILEAWIRDFDRADQSQQLKLLDQATQRFQILYKSTVKIEEALNARSRRRTFRFRGVFCSKKYGFLIMKMPSI